MRTSSSSGLYTFGCQPVLLALLVLCMDGACASRRVEPFSDAVRSYNDAVRWQRYDHAAARLPVNRREDFLDQRDQLAEDLRVSDYDVVRVRYDGTGRRAKIQLKYTWHLDSRGVVHTTHVVQRWERPKKIWMLVDEHHLRGEPMPGIHAAPAARQRSPKQGSEAETTRDSGDEHERNVRKRTESAAHSRRDVPR